MNINAIILKSGLKKEEAPDLKRKVREQHIDVDEDHVSLQDGSKVVVPLISIYEGIKRDGKRGECININHISGYGKSPEEIWLKAADWINNNKETIKELHKKASSDKKKKRIKDKRKHFFKC